MSQQQTLPFSDAPRSLADHVGRGVTGESEDRVARNSLSHDAVFLNMLPQDGISNDGLSRSSSGTPGGPGHGSRGRLPIWLQRFELFLRIVVRLYVGVLVMLLPWTHLWDDNRLLNYYPWLSEVALNGVVRGVVSGLGLLNLWVAVWEAIHYREHDRAK